MKEYFDQMTLKTIEALLIFQQINLNELCLGNQIHIFAIQRI